jgi:hypothetical protein
LKFLRGEKSDPRVTRLVGEIVFETVLRLEAQLLILGRTTALEKIGAFLLDLSERQGREAADGVVLPISRYDIADYLALSVETVSRSLTGLKERGLISFMSTRSFRIINRNALEDDPRITRGLRGELKDARSKSHAAGVGVALTGSGHTPRLERHRPLLERVSIEPTQPLTRQR